MEHSAWDRFDDHSLALEVEMHIHEKYRAYVAACDEEELSPHTFHMWKIHGCPEGPL